MDPHLSLALSMHSNAGVYALLLGSGVSRAAKIPTGWEVVVDLIERIAAMQGEDVAGGAVDWYAQSFGEEADYSKILGKLARHRDERQRLLREYFEPSDEEREEGAKQPTAAHRAIAHLCRRKYIRVIVTTNFDRLLEQALIAEDLQPTVISTADAVSGAPPLVHADLLIVKIHGDYLDTRIRNTTGELERYPRPLERLLDRIFDEFGLVVCGWSARWDPALRGALERCKNQRYTTYWTGVEEPDNALRDLLRLRRAEFIRIDGADEFFDDLHEKVLALEEHARPHPLSVESAVAGVKRYLADPVHDIRFSDLVMGETARILRELGGDQFSVSGLVNAKVAAERVESFEALTEILRAIFAPACFWAQDRHGAVLTRAIEDLGSHPLAGGNTFLLNLRFYPALLAVYVGGIAAVANQNWRALRAVLLDPRIRRDNGTHAPVLALSKNLVLNDDQAQNLPGMRKRHTALSQWLEPRIRDSLKPVITSDARYQEAFDRFEYLWGLMHADLYVAPWGPRRIVGPVGNFGWRHASEHLHPAEAVQQEIETLGADWPLLKHGMFTGDLDRLKNTKESFDGFWRGLGLGF
jgi:hypothetical protein